MDCRGLVDPKNKPFGAVLPLEVQIRIMFWVECIFTNKKRRKVNQELKGLPKCALTGFPQHLGEGQWWNQVIVRLNTPRRNGCHHCHRMMDHRFSVRARYSLSCTFSSSSHDLDSFFQIGMMAEMARVPPNLDNLMNECIAFVIDRFKEEIPNCPVGQRPVMIGRRKPAYDTIDKVMNRLDMIISVMDAMRLIHVVDIH